MFNNINLEDVIFFDIETVSEFETSDSLSEAQKELFMHKMKNQNPDQLPLEELYPKMAGLYAEFGKIACISIGYFQTLSEDVKKFRVSTLMGDEIDILHNFKSLLIKFGKGKVLCGHNSNTFDIPFIIRRYLIQNIEVPYGLDISGKKPWEIKHLDTMQEWRLGDFRYNINIKLLTNVLGIPTPKDDIDGSQVGYVFWVENDIKRIATYCEKDVIAVANIALRFQNFDILLDDQVTIV